MSLPVRPRTSSEIGAALKVVEAMGPAICTVSSLAFTTVPAPPPGLGPPLPDITPTAITIKAGTGSKRETVMFIGGVHGREMAPPDALVRFAEKLVDSYILRNAVTYPSVTFEPDSGGPIPLPSFRIPAGRIRKLLERIELIIVPLVNPQGRDHDIRDPTRPGGGWRKNRAVQSAAGSDPADTGVDINRNFNIGWKWEDFYNAAFSALVTTSPSLAPSSLEAASFTFRGRVAESENETKNVQKLIGERKPGWFVDVHQAGPMILFPWGLEEDGADATMNFRDPTRSGVPMQSIRDGLWHTKAHPVGTVDYLEFVPNTAPALLRTSMPVLAKQMASAVHVMAGRPTVGAALRKHVTYRTLQSAELYGTPVTGTSIDFAFARQFKAAGTGPVRAFTIEAGSSDEGGFHPDYGIPGHAFFPGKGQYQKIERDIHAALFELLFHATGLPTIT
jgi:hypothetical protein